MKKLSLLLVLVTTTSFAQSKRPMKEIFYLESAHHALKSTMASNQGFVSSFNEKYAKTSSEFEKYRALVKEIDTFTSRIKIIPEKKRTKQEKAFVIMSRCVEGLFENQFNKVTNIAQCAYNSNVDPRLFRKSAKGKILGESSEIQSQGDEISKFVDKISALVPSSDKLKEFKSYESSAFHKEYLEKDYFVRSAVELKALEADIADRKALDKKVAEELMGCKKEIAVPELGYQKLSQDGSVELLKDLVETVTEEKDISTNSYLTTSGSSVCRKFDDITFKGYCLEKKKKSRDISGDCETCGAKMAKMQGEELASHLAAIVDKENEDCKEKSKVRNRLGFVFCDVGITNDVRFEKNKEKQILKLRKLVATNVAQGLPVGKKQNDIYGSIVGMKTEAGVCKYLVRDLSKGKSSWVPEASILEGLQELSHILRR